MSESVGIWDSAELCAYTNFQSVAQKCSFVYHFPGNARLPPLSPTLAKYLDGCAAILFQQRDSSGRRACSARLGSIRAPLEPHLLLQKRLAGSQ